jgi:hypothetical protein
VIQSAASCVGVTPADKYENYAEEDFRFGVNAAQTTLRALVGFTASTRQ